MHPEDAEAWEWDDHNAGELARHFITPDEVEQVWLNGGVFVPNKRHRPGDWKMLGLTDGGRRPTIVLRTEPDRRIVRPITGWDSTSGERTTYFSGG